jgi:radical SAM superfamily enzyme YgiQ (UPF0313 family)
MLGMTGLILPIQSSRGCNFDCIFCAQEKINKKFRMRNIKKVVDEIEYMHKRFKVNNFGFLDSYFPQNISRGFEFCDEVLSRGLAKKIKWVTEMRVDTVDLKLIKKMKEAGLHLVMLGFESGDQQVLNAMSKGSMIEDSKKAMKVMKEVGILTLGFFMLGMPDETVQTCKETIRFAKELDCDMAKFNIVIPYPGTRLYDRYKNNLDPKCKFEDFNSWGAWLSSTDKLPFTPERMNTMDLICLQRTGMFTYYARPRIFLRHLKLKILSLRNILLGAYFLLSRLGPSLFKYKK